MDKLKRNLWTKTHSIIRQFPVLLNLYFQNGINKEELVSSLSSLREDMHKIANEANNIGGYYKHYLNLIKTQLELQCVLCFNKIDELSKKDIDLMSYEIQWNLLDLTEAELNRS